MPLCLLSILTGSTCKFLRVCRPPVQPAAQGEPPLPPPPLLPPRAGWAFPPLPSGAPRAGRGRPPFARHRHRRGGRETCPPPFQPRPPLRRPPAAEPRSCFAYARNDIPSARCPPETPRAPHLTATGISAPSLPGRAPLPARSGRRDRSLRPARLSARPASTPGRGDRRSGETFLRPFCPTALSARALRPARVPFRPQAGPFCRQRDAFILWRPNMELG